jgi:DNA-binding transcriptional LysR family regulator
MIDPALVAPLQDVLFVARAGSVAGAAQRLHKTPSAVSQQIRRVESHFGIQIFERRGRGVALTPQGEAAVGVVNRLFDETESVFGALTMLAATPTTVLRVAASDYLGRGLLLPALRRLLAQGIPVRFEITTAHSAAARRAVETGEADLAVVTGAQTDGARDVLRETTLCEQDFYWVAPRSAGRTRSLVQRIGHEPLLRLSAKSEGRRILESFLDAHSIRPVSTIDVPSVILMLSYVRAGLGVGLAPALALEAPGSRMSTERARIAARPVKLLTRANWRPGEVAARLLQLLATEAARRAPRSPLTMNRGR